jgi:UDP-N-acetylglucosamine 3-dehydrogenase
MKLGILGAGSMGSTHFDCYKGMPNIEVSAIYTRTREKAESLAKKSGVKVVTDFDEIINDKSIDAVDICLPTYLHKRHVISALQADKHVFCETPIALDIDEAIEMQKIAKEKKKIFMIALLMRNVAEYGTVKNIIDSNELGKPLTFRAYRFSKPYPTDHYPGPVIELLNFDFDFINWTFGLPDSIISSRIVKEERREHAAILLKYNNGLLGLAETGNIMPESFPFSAGIRIICEKGAIETVFTIDENGYPDFTTIKYPSQGNPEELHFQPINPHEEECKLFVESLNKGQESSLLSAQAAIDAITICLKAEESLEKGKEVFF